MRASLLTILLCLGCDPAVGGGWRGPALATLRGLAVVPEGRQVPEPVRVALVWTAADGARWTVDSASALQGPWPTHFTVPVSTLPPGPADAVLVAYSDVNQNLALDLSDDDGAGPHDVVVGASAERGDDGRVAGVQLRYFDDGAQAPAGQQRGFNLVGADGGVLAFSTELPLSLSMRLSLEAWRATSGAVTPVRAPRPLRLHGSLGRTVGRDSVILDVLDAWGPVEAASVVVNGRPLTPEDGGAHFTFGQPGLLTNATTVSASAPGYTGVTLSVSVPDGLEVLRPTFGFIASTTQPLLVQWAGPTTGEPVTVTVRDEAFMERYSARGSGGAHVIDGGVLPAGQLTVTVSADGVAAKDGAGRSEERRVGKECRRLCRSRWSPYH
jgi:hypothetical protein